MDMATALMAAQAGGGMAAAGQRVGAGLFGNSDASYQQGAGNAADMHTKLMKARKIRDEEVARQGIEAKLVAAGQSPEQASLMSGVMTAGFGNYSQTMQGEERRQAMGYRDLAHGAAINRYGQDNPNAHLFPLAKGPQAMGQAIGAGGYVADRFAGDAPVQTTDLGAAMIGAHNASANQRNAAANLSNVRASTGGYAPRSAGSGGSAGERVAKFTVPSHNELGATLTKTVGEGFNQTTVPDTERAAQFRAWQVEQAEHDPQYRDGNYALSQFIANRPALAQPVDFGAGPVRLKAGYPQEVVPMLKDVILQRRAAGEPDLSKQELNDMARQFRETGTASEPAKPGGVAAAARSAGVPVQQAATTAARSGAVTQSAPRKRLKYNPATGKIE